MSNIIIEPDVSRLGVLRKQLINNTLPKKYFDKLIFFKSGSGYDKSCIAFFDTADYDGGDKKADILKKFFEKKGISPGTKEKNIFNTPALVFDVELTGAPPNYVHFTISAPFIQAANPNLFASQVASNQQAANTGNQGVISGKASSANIALAQSQNGTRYVIYRIDDLKLLSFVTSQIMTLLKQKMDYYNVKLDKPININSLGVRIRDLHGAVMGIINDYKTAGGKETFDATKDFIKIVFSHDDYKFKQIYLVKDDGNGKPSATGPINLLPVAAGQQPNAPFYFTDATLNSLVYNLSAIYNKYNQSFQLNQHTTAPAGGPVASSVFVSTDELKMFLNTYIYPRSSIVINAVVKSLIEKFIIGDVRLLEDEAFTNYFPSGENFNDAFKNQMQQEISKQYEAIGDALGDAWIKGKFQEINTVEDYFEQLLNYIDINELIALSVKCLLKFIPLQDALDWMCKDVLEKFDEHKEQILQGLESMDDGIAKDLAKELKEIYFNQVLGEQLKWGEEIVAKSIQNTTDILKDADQRYSWTTAPLMKSFSSRLVFSYKEALRAVGPTEKLDELGPSAQKIRQYALIEQEERYVQSSSDGDERIKRLKERRDELVKNQAAQASKSSVFTQDGGSKPPHLQDLDAYYDKEIAKVQSQMNDLLEAEKNGIDQLKIYYALLYELMPRMIMLDPHLTQEEKDEVFLKYSEERTGVLSKPTNETEAQMIEAINSISAELYKGMQSGVPIPQGYINPDGTAFVFPNNYNGLKKQDRKNIFDINLVKFKQIIGSLEELQKRDTSPWSTLQKFEEFGTKTFDKYIEEIFKDENGTKRYYLCLAIYGAVPAAIYFIYQVSKNPEEVGEFFEDNSKAVGKAFKRKLDMFLRTDYPVRDIWDEVLEQFKQIGLNFARDLVLNGIMWVIRQIADFCAEEEDVNAPFNPVGVIDLSNFIINSPGGGSDGKIGSIGNSESFKEAKTIDNTLTPELYTQILDLISGAFSIRQICSMIDQTADRKLYDLAVKLISPLSGIQDTNFLAYYGNIEGMKELFLLIKKDFDYSFCAEAAQNFNDQKSKLIEICLGLDETNLANVLSQELDPEVVRSALASNMALKRQALSNLLPAIETLFKQNTPPDPCQDGSAKLEEIEINAARTVSNSIFGNLDETFELDIARFKTIFEDIESGMNFYRNIQPTEFQTTEQFIKNNAESLRSFQADRKIVANKVHQAYVNDINNETVGFKRYTSDTVDENADPVDSVGYDTGIEFDFISAPDFYNVKRRIYFSYDKLENKSNFEYSIVENVEATEPNENSDEIVPEERSFTLASYREDPYFESGQGPAETLFKYDSDGAGGVITQPKYLETVKKDICNFILDTNNSAGENNALYPKIINGMFLDLSLDSFKLGLYERENWEKLNLNKHLTSMTSNNGAESLCFLGFMNKTSFIEQVIKLSQRLVCYAPNSPTETPINVAIVKVATDAFIRSVAIKEYLKSIFVASVFPRGFGFYDNSPKSIYEQIIRSEILNSLNQRFDSDYYKFDNFYEDVLKKFVTEIVRILFQNEKITDEQAFQFEIDSQLAFVKEEVKSVIKSTFGSEDSFLYDKSEYQLLAENAAEASPDYEILIDNDSPTPPVRKADKIDQLDALTNDYLPINNGKTKIYIKGNQDSHPTIIMPEPNSEDGSFNQEDMKMPIPTMLGDISESAPLLDYNSNYISKFSDLSNQVNKDKLPEDGLQVEKFIEMRPKSSAFSNPEARRDMEEFLWKLGTDFGKGLVSGYTQGKNKRFRLKTFLYDTRLFMLFPQIISFIDGLYLHDPNAEPSAAPILDYIYDDNIKVLPDKYKNYLWEIEQTVSPENSESGQEETVVNLVNKFDVKQRFDLMYWVFKYNFDEDFFNPNNTDNIEWWNKFSKSSHFKYFDMSLSGKIYQKDFEYLLKRFTYSQREKHPNTLFWENNSYSLEYVEEDGISKDNKSLNIGSINDYLSTDWNNYIISNQYNGFFDFFEDSNPKLVSSIGSENTLGPSSGISLFSAKEYFKVNVFNNEGQYLGEVDKNLLEWLFSQRIIDLYDFNTVLRIDAKFKDQIGQISRQFYDEVFTPDVEFATIIGPHPPIDFSDYSPGKIQKTLADEKIGFERRSQMLQLPFFELKQPIRSNINWFDFFIKVDKASYYYDNDFYTINNLSPELILQTKNINDFLFDKDKKDVYSYFYKFAAYSTYAKTEQTVIEKVSYFHNIWFNIGGTDGTYSDGQRITLTEILDAVFIEGHPNKDFVLGALTEASVESFKSAAGKFIGNPYTMIKNDIFSPGDLSSGEPFNETQYPLRPAFASYQSGSYQEAAPNYGFISQAEYNVLIKSHLKLIYEQISPEFQDGVVTENGDWATGVTPFIQIKYDRNFGWSTLLPAGALNDPNIGQNMEKKFPGARFTHDRLFNINDGTPIGWWDIKPFEEDENGELSVSSPPYGAAIYGPIYGGLSVNKDIVPNFIGNIMTIYDLFIIVLYASDDNLKTFQKLLKSFFLREQTTIISLLHKVYVEASYPKIETNFNPSIKNALNILLSAAAAANGDYQHDSTSKDSRRPWGQLTSDEFTEALGQIGLGILKMFFGAMANTVDPTWKTPWLLPGPLTPFGIAAKLMNEDFDSDKQGDIKEQEQVPILGCEIKLSEQASFFENYLKTYTSLLPGAPIVPSQQELGNIIQAFQNTDFGNGASDINISSDLLQTLANAMSQNNNQNQSNEQDTLPPNSFNSLIDIINNQEEGDN